MGLESAGDRLLFLNTSDFAETWSSGAISFRGIFTEEDSDELDVEGTQPVLVVRDDDVTGVPLARADTLTRTSPSQTYAIRGLEPDGTGFTTLRMERLT